MSDLAARWPEGRFIAIGHAGDGNIHVNIMIDRDIPGMEEKAQGAIREVFQAARAQGWGGEDIASI